MAAIVDALVASTDDTTKDSHIVKDKKDTSTVSRSMQSSHCSKDRRISSGLWWTVFWTFTLLAIYTRLRHISEPNVVVWDEGHFGKYMSYYINGTFFSDVHPPGGKLLLALFAKIAGYNGTHSFVQPDTPYDGYDEIVYIRVCCALMGSSMVPLAFHSTWLLTSSLVTASIAAALITFEIGSITLSQYILLDPLLMFFDMASFHGLCVFNKQKDRSFSLVWWSSLVYLGSMLGCVMSTKFIGAFIVITVGLYIITDLWKRFGDLKHSMVSFVSHFASYALCLIILPVVMYVLIFAVHDYLLYKVKPDDPLGFELGIFSPGFQKRIKGNDLYDLKQPKELAYGNLVSLRTNPGGCYLHSHSLTYPERFVKGHLQQVTGYRAKDVNNDFRILYPDDDPDQADGYYTGAPEVVMHGDMVRLYHLTTRSLLSCSGQKSVMSGKHNLLYTKPTNLTEWSEAGQNSPEGLREQLWEVRITTESMDGPVQALNTSLQFICVNYNCALTWTDKKLPPDASGYRHQEVSCSKNTNDPKTVWQVEKNINPYMAQHPLSLPEPGFIERFIETHQVMLFVNARLTPYIPEGHRPWHWPLCLKSQVWFHNRKFRIVLLGNPVIFWINLIVLLTIPGLLIHHHFNEARGYNNLVKNKDVKDKMIFSCHWLLIAYLLHYVPFFPMNRILYYHHYFPTLQYSSMLTAVVLGYLLENFTSNIPEKMAPNVLVCSLGIFITILMYSYSLFSAIGYGYATESEGFMNFNLTNSTYNHIRVFDDWMI